MEGEEEEEEEEDDDDEGGAGREMQVDWCYDGNGIDD